MTYMGSKRRYCKYIVPILQKYINDNNISTFVDIFCGGANLIDKIQCNNLIANDLSPTLIALHKQAQEDFSLIPEDGSREYWDLAYAEWKKIKTDNNYEPKMPLYKIGAIEWYSSFANGGFPRGYAKSTQDRNYYQEAYRNHQKQSNDLNYKNINFICSDYLTFDLNKLPKDTIIYCDSPYKGTKPYGISPKFNHEEYYDWLRKTSEQFPIFISEQTMPDDFEIIWSKDEVNRTCGLDNNFKACEKLFFIDKRV